MKHVDSYHHVDIHILSGCTVSSCPWAVMNNDSMMVWVSLGLVAHFKNMSVLT